MLNRKTFIFSLALAGTALSGTDVLVIPSVEPKNGNPKPGEDVTFSFLLTEKNRKTSIPGKEIRYKIQCNGLKTIKTGSLESADKPVSISVKAEKNSWYYTTVEVFGKDGSKCRILNPADRNIGAVTNPKEYRSAIPEPNDFDAFWKKALEEVKAVPLKATLKETPVPEKYKGKFRLYDVKVDCAGGAPVSGYLTVPGGKKDKTYPAIVRFHGAGVRSSNPYFEPGAVTFDTNAHGIENGKDRKFYQELARTTLRGYERRNSTDPAKCYFRGIYQRALRALDFVMSRPEWNRKDLIVMGGSQAGALAVAAAALYPKQVTLCVTDFPAMCDQAGSLAENPRTSGWPNIYSADNSKPIPEKIRKTMECMNYFDTVHFGKRLECPFYTSIGYADSITPPAGIHALVNNISPDLVESVTIRANATHGGIHSWKGRAEIKNIVKDNLSR